MCLPVFAFLAELVFEVSQGEAVGLHDAAVGDLLTAEEVGDHQVTTQKPGEQHKERRDVRTGRHTTPGCTSDVSKHRREYVKRVGSVGV